MDDAKREVDVLVVGAGVAGLSAATASSFSGRKVVVIEKSETVGGTALYANGSIWIPQNYLAKQKGIEHNTEDEIRFILSECCDSFSSTADHYGAEENQFRRVHRYVMDSPKVIEDLVQSGISSFTQLDKVFDQFFYSKRDSLSFARRAMEEKKTTTSESELMVAAKSSWDYHWDNDFNQVPYGKHIWASVDVRATTKFFLRGLREHTWDILKNILAIRSFASIVDQLPKLFAKFWGFGHGMILTERFRRYLKKKRVPVFTNHELAGIDSTDGKVVSVQIRKPGGVLETWSVKKSLILASGCFSHEMPKLNSQFKSSCVAATNSGDSLRLLGNTDVLKDQSPKPLLAQTVMQLAKQKGGVSHEPVFFLYGDSFFVVDRYGQRIMNEKLNYHDRAKHHLSDPNREFLILVGDRRFKERNWGFGISLPFDQRFVLHAKSPSELQVRIDDELEKHGSDFRLSPEFSTNLAGSKILFNQFAESGRDKDFGRGANAYDVLGFLKPDHDNRSPSRSMHPLQGDDLYACIYGLSTFSTHGGLTCDEFSRVLNNHGQAWQNLYAVGTCAANFLNGNYPSHGMSIGTGLVFGYLAGLHATCNLERIGGAPQN